MIYIAKKIFQNTYIHRKIGDNIKINSISLKNFKGIYVSNSTRPGKQRELANILRDTLNDSGYSSLYEDRNIDILLKPGLHDSIIVEPAKFNQKRILDDNYSRWNGRFD